MIRVGRGKGALDLDPRKLVGGCALVQGTRGSGKSYLVRVIAEQVIPSRLQTIILDPEGEFGTLREKCEVLIAGPDGDVPCEVRSAKVLSRRVAELGCSTVIDMSGLTPGDQADYVAAFLSALDRLPKTLEAPRLLVLDEAHRFCPESGKGRATSSDAVVLLMSQGRKRGLGAILVTQRLSKLRNDAAAEAANIFIGRTSPIDVRRAQELLGVTTQDREAMRSLEAGEFFATGPALSSIDVVRFRARRAETTHPEPGMRGQSSPRPPRAAMRRLIAELHDLPPSAEQEEAASLEAAKRRIAELETRLAKGVSSAAVDAMRVQIADLESEVRRLVAWIEDTTRALGGLLDGAPTPTERPRRLPMVEQKTRARPVAPTPTPKTSAKQASRGGRFHQMLVALAQHGALDRKRLALLVGMSAKGGGFSNYVSRGKVEGLWTTTPDGLEITLAGREAAGAFEPLPTGPALLDFWCNHQKVPGKAADMLRGIAAAGETGLSREALADLVGMSPSGGGFNNYISRLRTLELISRASPFVAAADLR